MKRFLLFSGDEYYPCGGMNDFKGDYDTLDEAKDALIKIALDGDADWGHIYDTLTKEMAYVG
jgi:hypothetical protein